MSDLFDVEKGRGVLGTSDGARTRRAPRAAATSDLIRVSDMAVAAVVGALALVAALVFVPAPAGLHAPGPLGRPHSEAKIACAACHDGASPAAACVGCHGAAAHSSTRPAHRALAAKGLLGCTDCHSAHGDARGVTFGAAGDYVAWAPDYEARGRLPHATPAGATVPLVPTAACARCHDRTSRKDPLAVCTLDDVTTCFDEHTRADAPPLGAPAQTSAAPSPGARCARQHTSARYVAWEAAREVARVSPPGPSGRGKQAPWAWLSIALVTATSSLFGMRLVRHRRGRRRVVDPTPLAPAPNVRLPQINTGTCLGCYACVDACPFDVLEIQRYVAVVVRPNDCCGVVLCQQVCPNGSLVITEGEPIEERPNVDSHLESRDAPGVFLAGDLTGLPLIKNAINQGRRVVDRVSATLPAGERGAHGGLDLVIIGAGPAGISASLRAKELGLSYVALEQGTVASSVRSFPRAKLVFDQPLDLPVEGEMWLQQSTKEELLAQWTRIVRGQKLAIREGHRVTSIERENGVFRVHVTSASGPIDDLVASRLVVAIGRRGTPRPLSAHIAQGAEASVSYALADARSFAGQRVVVVGLGDAAMEAAVALARQPATAVTVSYRGADFLRGKARNVAEMKRLSSKGAIRIVFQSEVVQIEPGAVTLTVKGRHERLAADAVLVLIGGMPSWDLVRQAGVKLVARMAQERGSAD